MARDVRTFRCSDEEWRRIVDAAGPRGASAFVRRSAVEAADRKLALEFEAELSRRREAE